VYRDSVLYVLVLG